MRKIAEGTLYSRRCVILDMQTPEHKNSDFQNCTNAQKLVRLLCTSCGDQKTKT